MPHRTERRGTPVAFRKAFSILCAQRSDQRARAFLADLTCLWHHLDRANRRLDPWVSVLTSNEILEVEIRPSAYTCCTHTRLHPDFDRSTSKSLAPQPFTGVERLTILHSISVQVTCDDSQDVGARAAGMMHGSHEGRSRQWDVLVVDSGVASVAGPRGTFFACRSRHRRAAQTCAGCTGATLPILEW
jgi:hypothetical protein